MDSMNNKRSGWARWRALAAVAAMSALVVGCGGGGADTAAQSASAVLQVQGWTQPASADQGVASVKSRGLGTAPTPATVALGPLATEKTQVASGGIGPRQVGAARDVAATKTAAQTQAQLQWKPSANGGMVSAISFSAEGAHGLRLGVVVRQLPPATQLRVYSQAHPGTVFQIAGQEVLQRIARNAQAGDTTLDGQTWWTPDLGTDEVTLEVEVPPGAPVAAVDIAIPRVSHIFENLALPTESEFSASTKINESAGCELDASCYDDYASQRNAVARMIFTSGGSTYACTGTLINDTQNSGTPYFLTANHCISTQAAASSLQTDWFYRSSACNTRTLSSATTKRLNGASLLYASDSTDTSLLRLNDAPPPGAVFAGWDASAPTSGMSVVGLHHPRADMLKASFGTVTSQAACVSTGETSFQCSGTVGNFHRVAWSQGTTEGGSSGSALFKNGTQIIGTLYGGSSTCTAVASPEFYGRFDVAYNAALKTWLAPSSGGGSGNGTGRVPVYRFYNTAGLEHFYTANPAERDLLVNQYAASFIYEGPVFYAYPGESSGLFPVYRMVDVSRKIHLYTANPAERDAVLAMPSVYLEGNAWWSQAAPGNGSTPVYRYFNRAVNTFFYTTSEAERAYINANLSQQYLEQGVGFYVWLNP